MKIIEYFSVNNECYKSNLKNVDSRYTTFQKKGARGLMLHSVGCPQPDAEVFAKIWNRSGTSVAVHAVLQADGTVYQCLPFNFRGWHAGGDANNTHVGVEMTEPECIKYTTGASFVCTDHAKAKAHVEGTYKTAVELFAFLCTKYNLDPMVDIISHSEGYKKGIASGHSDPEHLWKGLGLGYTMDTFRKAVKEAMVKHTTPTTGEEMYRVRKSWANASSQIGAFRLLKYAQLMADKNPGFYVFNNAGKCVYPVVTKSVEDIAREVIAGKWYSGAARKSALTKAGYNYDEVQAKVNELLNANKKSVTEIAKEVIAGKWGNGADRKKKLTAAGYDYDAVQKAVNKLLD